MTHVMSQILKSLAVLALDNKNTFSSVFTIKKQPRVVYNTAKLLQHLNDIFGDYICFNEIVDLDNTFLTFHYDVKSKLVDNPNHFACFLTSRICYYAWKHVLLDLHDIESSVIISGGFVTRTLESIIHTGRLDYDTSYGVDIDVFMFTGGPAYIPPTGFVKVSNEVLDTQYQQSGLELEIYEGRHFKFMDATTTMYTQLIVCQGTSIPEDVIDRFDLTINQPYYMPSIDKLYISEEQFADIEYKRLIHPKAFKLDKSSKRIEKYTSRGYTYVN